MQRYIRTTLLILILLLTTVPAIADQLIIEPDMGRAPILNSIRNARQSIHLVMYGFTDRALLDALLAQQQSGRSLKVILERSPFNAADENTRTITAFNEHHVDWIGKVDGMRLIHQKTLLIDGKQAMVMTFNFTNSTFDKKASHPARNFALVLDNVRIVRDLEAFFSADWNQVPSPGNFNNNIIYSPNNSRAAFTYLIDRASSSITMYAQSISDYKILDALTNAARRGVRVSILVAKAPRDNQFDRLKNAGVNIEVSKHYYIHAKAMIIDNQMAVVGSINLTRQSLDDNRELAVITQNPAIIKTLNNTFKNDWQDSEVRVARSGKKRPRGAVIAKSEL